jgi:hypothetical protein
VSKGDEWAEFQDSFGDSVHFLHFSIIFFDYLRSLFMFSKPDYIILIAAFVSFLFSISLWFGVFGPDNRDAGIFVGLWVPSILGFGLFFKTSAKGRQI